MSSNKLPDTEIFCKNLKFLINTEGVSQRNLAAEMGMSESNLSRILKRVSSPSHDQLVFIAERFGVSLNWLMRGIEPMLLKDISTGPEQDELLTRRLLNLEKVIDQLVESSKDVALIKKKLGLS